MGSNYNEKYIMPDEQVPKGKIAVKIENDFGTREFTPQEQATVHLDVLNTFGVSSYVDEKTVEFERRLLDLADNDLLENLDALIRDSNNLDGPDITKRR